MTADHSFKRTESVETLSHKVFDSDTLTLRLSRCGKPTLAI
jgi:hypothetical protein